MSDAQTGIEYLKGLTDTLAPDDQFAAEALYRIEVGIAELEAENKRLAARLLYLSIHLKDIYEVAELPIPEALTEEQTGE